MSNNILYNYDFEVMAPRVAATGVATARSNEQME
jgi:hypothetical protein